MCCSILQCDYDHLRHYWLGMLSMLTHSSGGLKRTSLSVYPSIPPLLVLGLITATSPPQLQQRQHQHWTYWQPLHHHHHHHHHHQAVLFPIKTLPSYTRPVFLSIYLSPTPMSSKSIPIYCSPKHGWLTKVKAIALGICSPIPPIVSVFLMQCSVLTSLPPTPLVQWVFTIATPPHLAKHPSHRMTKQFSSTAPAECFIWVLVISHWSTIQRGCCQSTPLSYRPLM